MTIGLPNFVPYEQIPPTLNDPKRMQYDKREIDAIVKDYSSYLVGENGVTAIVHYMEPSDMGLINYAAIFNGDFLSARVDLRGWTVVYKEVS